MANFSNARMRHWALVSKALRFEYKINIAEIEYLTQTYCYIETYVWEYAGKTRFESI